jgi:hypothetical protein
MSNENEIYINIIKNIDLIKHKLNTIKDYTEKNNSSKSIEYIEKLHPEFGLTQVP